MTRSRRGNPQFLMQQGIFYMHFTTYRIVHSTDFDIPDL